MYISISPSTDHEEYLVTLHIDNMYLMAKNLLLVFLAVLVLWHDNKKVNKHMFQCSNTFIISVYFIGLCVHLLKADYNT